MTALLEVQGLEKRYRLPRGRVLQAVAGVSFAIAPGEVLALVGESGCGKSTIGRCLLRLEQSDGGETRFAARASTGCGHAPFARCAGASRWCFQDPYGSLDPRMRVSEILAEPLVSLGPGAQCARSDCRACWSCSTWSPSPRASAERRPHEFSGGQRQRIGIAPARSRCGRS